MSSAQHRLIELARMLYTNIYPCATKVSFEECFTSYGGKYLFWFNTADNSTHILAGEKERETGETF